MLIDARKNFDSLELILNNTQKEMADQIVDIAKDAINRGKSLGEICKTIRTNVESEFDGMWQCSAIYDGNANYSCIVDTNFHIKLIFGKLIIAVHKIHEKVSYKKMV